MGRRLIRSSPRSARSLLRRHGLIEVSLFLVTAGGACANATVEDGLIDSPADVAAELTPAACLSQSPVDLSVDLNVAPPSFYVNELKLGYSRGEAIFLSRPLCDMYGKPLCRFVEAHEQAHHYTKTVGQKSACAETLADCWAAAHADSEAVEAALFFFRSQRGAGGYHGEPSVRADTIARCLRRSSLERALASDGSDEAVDTASGADPAERGTSAEAIGGPRSVRPRPGRAFRASGRARR
jgi:hypothetical protein